MPETLDPLPAAAPVPAEPQVVTALRMYIELLNDVRERTGGPKGFMYQVAGWHIMLKVLKLLENHFPMGLEEAEKVHSDVLDQVISVGISIQRHAACEQINFSKADHGTTMEEMQANLDWLRDTRAMWHGDVTPKRRAVILQSLFGDVAA